jgi:CRISPR-associated endonuclease/helicase Cas3
MNAMRLWAKSWDEARNGPPPDNVFLPNHLLDAYSAAVRVMDATGDDQLAAVGLTTDAWRDRARQIVLLAAAVHDLGKANDHFQEMIAKNRDVRVKPQGLRHEWVSLLILQQLRDWLLPAVGGLDDDFALVEWAVAGHHPAHNHASPPRLCPSGAGTEIRLLTDCNDFHAALGNLHSLFELGQGPPNIAADRLGLVGPENVFTLIAAWFRKAQRTWERLRRTEHRLLAAVAKNCLIAADVAGSALPKLMPDDDDLWDWITKSFSAKPEDGDLKAIVDFRLKGEIPRDFQIAVAASSEPVTVVKAGCGTGKTLAAYMWGDANYPTRRLYFCYPTTGTATEGFKDYLFPAEAEVEQNTTDGERVRNLGAKLFHSRRDVDLEIILSTGMDTERSDVDAAQRIESLEAWSTPVVACTVDTVLGLIQNNKRGLFAWPALAQSAFVFDEIHAYDDRLFGALLRFLRDLPGLPTLLMTASLPASREQALRNVLESRQQEWNPIAGPESLETMPRYHKATAEGNDPLPLIRRELAEGGKVLWVCNTVNRVMSAADEAAEHSPLLYHSRFKYEDRVERHKAVVQAFTPKHKEPALAICSQVAEMSLDLKGCTLLVTELATVPALIQRLGRLNRQAEPGHPTRPFVVIEPENHLPYTPADLQCAHDWLSRLPANGISQRALAEMWEDAGDQPPDLVVSAWLDGGPVSTVSDLREVSPGVTVILQSDLLAVLRYRKRIRREEENARTLGKSPDLAIYNLKEGETVTARVTLPMPPPSRMLDRRKWPPPDRGITVVPDNFIEYKALRGARWQR